ncbi:hypothetical protein GOBAR_AA10458 [Gossypium barbadense]|uniref:Uncharacterized protein n=1 Tax=Gossypium barbadense TaxID=3634 RepID=A0A2P5Y3N1_GOSBA|nr:hypothetical protein GOBAR_AA10458 [Gossypium barbadense]
MQTFLVVASRPCWYNAAGSFCRHLWWLADHHSPRVARGTGGSTGSMKWCMCSPTKHPGSFRCRHHHADYVWGGRFITKK